MRSVLVPAEAQPVLFDFDPEDSDSWCLAVAGLTVDLITLREQGLQVIVDGQSLVNGKPRNERVTWFLKGTGRWLSVVHGTVLIVGVDVNSGESLDVPDILADALTQPLV